MPVSKSAKSTSTEHLKASFYLPKELHKRLKHKSVELGQDLSDLATQAIEEWLSKRLSD